LPKGENLNFTAGGYIQIYIPPYNLTYSEFEVEKEYHEDWDTFKLWDLKASNDEEIFRAYSMANHPAEGNIVMLNVRIATPPPRTEGIPPGKASSYIFNLKPGDKVTVSGPYGEFFAKDTKREMVYIGGGAGMAPMRSHLFDLFHTRKTDRKVSFWYGARSMRENFYEDEFQAIQKDFPNFSYNLALSAPLPEDNWEGPTGFIHQVLLDNYLKDHPDPGEIEYYLCGPPMMIDAVQRMLDDLGVEPEMIAYDSFG
ncbi:MAG: NADH:ubiquinone reductase (Na(+)-transporting) subunit F, partial [Candidatus Omnitrophica bacterium]|nr:NADH:ubiquinone reductase (Na(+)-transporting) subunit F [Candidatus Omnitrophota bacterium]